MQYFFYFLLNFQDIISKELFQDFTVLHLPNSFYKILYLQFFICILLSVFLFYVFWNPPVSLYDILKLEAFGVHDQSPLQFPQAVIVTRPDERGEQACTLNSGSWKGSDKPVV